MFLFFMDLGYINARIRAWKGEFFKEEDYNNFLSIDSLDGFLGKLKVTSYEFDIEESKARFGEKAGITILEKGLKGNLSRTFSNIWDELPSDARPLIGFLLSIWDIYNLKTIIRGIHRGINPDEIYSILIPAGDFDESALKELARQREIQVLIDALNTWDNPYGKVLKENFPAYKKNKEIIAMELALDRFINGFYLGILKKNDFNASIVKEIIRDRIDITNIINIFKFINVQSSYPILNYFLEGGKRLSEEDFLELCGYDDIEEILNRFSAIIKDIDWREKFKKADPRDISGFEEEMEDLIEKNICKKAVVYPLSIAVVFCFYFRKVKEIKNLRLIGIGKEFSIPQEEIKRYLLL